MRPIRLIAVLSLLLVGAAFWMGTRVPQASDDDFYAMRKNFELFGAIYEEVVGSYMSRVDPERFMRHGIEAMLQDLDPWTQFHDEAYNAAVDLRGRRMLGSVGLKLGLRGGRMTVLVPDQATGAYRQGMRAGDIIETIGGQAVDSLDVRQVFSLLDGDPGSTVDVEALRGDESLVFSLVREAPSLNSVTFAERLPGSNIVLVRLQIFGNGASGEIAKAIRALQESGPIDGVILDLRGNPGGLLNEAIQISQLFVPNGSPVVSTRGRAPESNRLFRTSSEPLVADAPLAVLMNRFSASASEIVAGVIQDLDRGVVLGEDSFGKGLVQVLRPLPYNTSMRVTTSRYYTPSGRGIRKDALEYGDAPIREFQTEAGRLVREGQGIEPDIDVDDGDAGDLEEALVRFSAFFRYADVIVAQRRSELEAAAMASGRLILPGDVIDGFGDWLEEEGFNYRSPFEREVGQLDSPNRDVNRALEALRTAARLESEALFDSHRTRWEHRLRQEVAARLLGPAEQVRAAVPDDPYMQAAIDVLQSRGRYSDLLTP